MVARTQQESEQPAKVYQLDAVETKVDQVNKKMDTLLQQTSGLVTHPQLEIRIEELKEEFEKRLTEQRKSIDKEYKPIKRAAWAVSSVVITGVIIQVIFNLLTLGGK